LGQPLKLLNYMMEEMKMKSKFILSLLLAACVTLSAAAMVTNANFTAVATSNGNTITMGTVQLGNDQGQVGKSIEMGTLFSIPNLASTTTTPVTTTRSIAIKGTLPVKLSLGTYADNANKVDDVTAFPTNVISTWWKHYKSNVLVSVARTNGTTDSYTSRPDSVQGGFDSIFDTIEGTAHNPSTENTTGISELLGDLGTLNPGDVVTITTKTEFFQTAYYTTKAPELDGPAYVNGPYTLTQSQLDAFQGQKLAINLKLVATEQ
jgi:predicted ribosomally synthesized peptide with SipW-like signal peptide